MTTTTEADQRLNNFDFLRHAAAFMVIFGHSFALLQLPSPGAWAYSIETLGVLVFFSISGFLIAGSWVRDPQIAGFMAKRALRIFPALWVCVLLTALVLGPLVTTMPTSQYFQHPFFMDYFYNFLLNIFYFLPGVFSNNPYPNAVNGSLWTLPVEFLCYIMIAVAGMFAKFGRLPLLVPIVFATAVLFAIDYYFQAGYHGPQIVLYATDVRAALEIIPYFLVGALLSLKVLRRTIRLDLALGAAFLLVLVSAAFPWALLYLMPLLFPYIVLAFGLASTPVINRFGRFGDFSYGMYLYAFPLQQLIILSRHGAISPRGVTALATIGAVIMAFLSWHLVEKRALRLKPRVNRPVVATAPVPVSVEGAIAGP